MKHSKYAVITAIIVVAALTTLAAAQTSVDRHAAFAAAAKTSTSVGRVEIIAGPPKGFNALTASNEELWRYGLPEAPDKSTNPMGYAQWARGMAAMKTRATNVKAMPFSSKNMMSAGNVTPQIDGATLSTESLNWSGLASTNKLTKWNTKTSFSEVVSYFTVPTVELPIGAPCADGPWYDATWNGIDGFANGDVVQGGTLSFTDGSCGDGTEYIGWVEWYPSYPILTIYCGNDPCPVNPGDLFEVVTYGAPGTDEQYVFVEDWEQGWSGTFGLPYESGPGLVGSSAEYIVERPCCNGNGYPLPLANYLIESLPYNYAYDAADKLFYPGKANYAITMLADDGSTEISLPFLYGTAGNSGLFSTTLESADCAFDGGCTP